MLYFKISNALAGEYFYTNAHVGRNFKINDAQKGKNI